MPESMFDDEIKVRVPAALKAQFDAEAQRRRVKAAHLLREALFRYAADLPPAQEPAPVSSSAP